MQHVDALSRHPVMLVTSDELTYKIVNAQESDEYIRTIRSCCKRKVKLLNSSLFISRSLVREQWGHCLCGWPSCGKFPHEHSIGALSRQPPGVNEERDSASGR
ncbi:hypothetical protein TNCV_363331 [Trichonephila clavipes]|nr:hypothetical protein TNCV_363331 [Trichonephila clavipes]